MGGRWELKRSRIHALHAIGGNLGDLPDARAVSVIHAERMASHPDVLISDSDRELVAVQLRNAHVEGRLTLEQLRDRIELLHQAASQADVAALLRDLPGPAGVERRTAVAPAAPADNTRLRRLWTVWLSVVSVGLVLGALETVAPGAIPYLSPGGTAWQLLVDLWLISMLSSGAVLTTVTAVRRFTKKRA